MARSGKTTCYAYPSMMAAPKAVSSADLTFHVVHLRIHTLNHKIDWERTDCTISQIGDGFARNWKNERIWKMHVCSKWSRHTKITICGRYEPLRLSLDKPVESIVRHLRMDRLPTRIAPRVHAHAASSAFHTLTVLHKCLHTS
jgi:hypothetical protein